MPYDEDGVYYNLFNPAPPVELDDLGDPDVDEEDEGEEPDDPSDPEPDESSDDDGSFETRPLPIVPVKLREYRADAAKLLGFFPPVVEYEPSAIRPSSERGKPRPLEWGEMLQLVAHDKAQKAALQPEPYFGV